MNLNATLIGQAIAFLIFIILCMKYIWPPIISAINQRQKEIIDGIACAEEAKNTLKKAQIQAREQFKQAQEQALLIITQSKNQSTNILENVKIESEKERRRILQLAKVEIELMHSHLYNKLQKQVAKLVIDGVEKIIEHSIDEHLDRKIINKLISNKLL
ncbi:MAG: F0F1 ATP synthase subunit B [Candidatus Dasytiphilus stammeri]